MKKYFLSAYRILSEIFANGTYSNLAIYGKGTSDMTTKLVYGVLEQNVQIEYILSALIDKKPKTPVYILLKTGVYALNNLTDVPDYAIVSECVEAAKAIGKEGASGFINAVLKKVAAKSYTLPNKGDADYLSVTYSKPQWFIDKFVKQYGVEQAIKMLEEPGYELEHIRINKKVSNLEAVKNSLEKSGVCVSESSVGGLNVKACDETIKLFNAGTVTYQSPSSILAVDALNPLNGSKILDLCSAPGGKAVYIAEKCPDSKIIACDIHPHRVDLIKNYARRMKIKNIVTAVHDARNLKNEWVKQFDFVLLDAPCSCFGTYRKHPDVFLTKGEADISSICKTQKAIIDRAMEYVADGGVLLYSTCTIFKDENDDMTNYILSSGKFKLEKAEISFENMGSLQIFPHAEWDGFYIAKFRKQ